MSAFGPALRRFRRDERGATAIEYALIGTLIGVVIISALVATGNNLQANFWDQIAAAL